MGAAATDHGSTGVADKEKKGKKKGRELVPRRPDEIWLGQVAARDGTKNPRRRRSSEAWSRPPTRRAVLLRLVFFIIAFEGFSAFRAARAFACGARARDATARRFGVR